MQHRDTITTDEQPSARSRRPPPPPARPNSVSISIWPPQAFSRPGGWHLVMARPCHLVQGNLLGRPSAPGDLQPLLEA